MTVKESARVCAWHSLCVFVLVYVHRHCAFAYVKQCMTYPRAQPAIGKNVVKQPRQLRGTTLCGGTSMVPMGIVALRVKVWRHVNVTFDCATKGCLYFAARIPLLVMG